MTAITYRAKNRLVGGRSALAAGHTAGLYYTLETQSEKLDPWDKEDASRQVSMDGTPEALLRRIDEGCDVQSADIEPADLPYWREFSASVRAAEEFTFDALGTAAAPVDPRPAVLEPNSFKLTRVESSLVMRASFKVRFIG